MSSIRLQKLLAAAGVGSRRYCEGLIRQGRVSVDGQIIYEMGARVSPGAHIEADGAPVRIVYNGGGTDAGQVGAAQYTYIIMNKPLGIISSAKDQFGRKTVVDIVRGDIQKRVYPVGRLDYDTSGLILLTDDGDFTYRATHPKFNVEKAYNVFCGKPCGAPAVEQLRRGVDLGDGARSSPARVYRDKADPRKLTIVIHEGRNRQVRKMCEEAGLSVLALERAAIGGLGLGGLKRGEWRIIPRKTALLAFNPYSHSNK